LVGFGNGGEPVHCGICVFGGFWCLGSLLVGFGNGGELVVVRIGLYENDHYLYNEK